MSQFNSEAEFEAAANADVAALIAREETVLLSFSPVQAWCLLMAVQLASRHPDAANNRASQIAANAVQDLISQVADTPALREIVRRGWSREYDVEPEA